MTSYHVSATSHWPNYLPEYIAVANGYFADEGLDFSRDAPDDWTGVLRSLADGSAQAVLGGLWVPAMYHGRGHDFVAFAQLNARNPKAIVTREPQPDFQLVRPEGQARPRTGRRRHRPLHAHRWAHPPSRHRPAPTSASSATSAARPCPISSRAAWETPSSSTWSTPTSSNTKAWARSPTGTPTPAVSMPNSVYYTLPHLIGEPDSAPWRFTRAIQRAMNWMNDHDGTDCTDLLTHYWPQLPLEVLIDSVDDLKKSGIWTDVRIDPDGFDSWMKILAGEWLIDAATELPRHRRPRPRRGRHPSSRLHGSVLTNRWTRLGCRE